MTLFFFPRCFFVYVQFVATKYDFFPHAPDVSQPHDCQRCCLSFATLEEHQQHIQKVHPKEFHKCATCDKVFSSAALLEKHQTTHKTTKPFSCELCNKSYQVTGDTGHFTSLVARSPQRGQSWSFWGRDLTRF